MFKTAFFGYKKSSVDFYIKDTMGYIDVLQKDVAYLKQELEALKKSIGEIITDAKIKGDVMKAYESLEELTHG